MTKKVLSCFLLIGLALSVAVISPHEVSAFGKRRVAPKRATTKRPAGKRSVKRSARVVQSSRRSGRIKKAGRRGGHEAMMSANGRFGRRMRGYRRISGPASAMPADRVREIQEALKREGFFEGESTGQYDKATVDAMTNYQKSHNFRATGYPTAEALQSLGLTKNRNAGTSSEGKNSETQSQDRNRIETPEAEQTNRK